VNTPDIPLIDISRWRSGTQEERRALATRLDSALTSSGFLMVENHGVTQELKDQIRDCAHRFFALAPEQKSRYATVVGGRGWVPAGREANSFYGVAADATRADMKESLTFGRALTTGDDVLDREWFAPNVFPAEVPELASLCAQYADQVQALYVDLLHMCAAAVDLDESWFERYCLRSPHTLNINRYPPRSETGAAQDGQYRVGPHTDWGVLTILDRQPGYGGLQVQTPDGTWVDAPYAAGAFTVNVGDLLARWTNDRWRSTRHRVLPPPAEAPGEELISLIVFLEADVDALIEPIGPGSSYAPVTAGEYYLERLNAASIS
jgi:isopenicillin N synthase-like dioxygenase